MNFIVSGVVRRNYCGCVAYSGQGRKLIAERIKEQGMGRGRITVTLIRFGDLVSVASKASRGLAEYSILVYMLGI